MCGNYIMARVESLSRTDGIQRKLSVGSNWRVDKLLYVSCWLFPGGRDTLLVSAGPDCGWVPVMVIHSGSWPGTTGFCAALPVTVISDATHSTHALSPLSYSTFTMHCSLLEFCLPASLPFRLPIKFVLVRPSTAWMLQILVLLQIFN